MQTYQTKKVDILLYLSVDVVSILPILLRYAFARIKTLDSSDDDDTDGTVSLAI